MSSDDEKLAKVLKESLSLDLDFDESDSRLTVSLFFKDKRILHEQVYLDHSHTESDPTCLGR